MPELRIHKDVDASADRVWEVMTDMDRWTETVSGIQRVQRLDDGDGFGGATRKALQKDLDDIAAAAERAS